MRAGLRVVKERADLFRHFRAERVFDPAGVIVNHVVVDSKGFAEQALGEAMPPHHVLRPSFTVPSVALCRPTKALRVNSASPSKRPCLPACPSNLASLTRL